MTEDIVPTYNKDQMRRFLQDQESKGRKFPELLPTLPKFLIHVPALSDGGGMIEFANIKEAAITYRQTDSTLKIRRAEGQPQRVATDGSGWIVVNSSNEFDASKWKDYITQAWLAKNKQTDRAFIEDSLRFIQGFNVKFKTEDGKKVIDHGSITVDSMHGLNLAFDVYSMPQRDKDLKYEDTPHKGASGGSIAGLFYKKPEPYKTFFITGHFKVEYIRGDSWHQVQEYKEGAYITIDPRGEISSIDPTNIDSCYGFLKEGVDFKDVKPGADRAAYVAPVSQGMERIPKFTRGTVNGALQKLALAKQGYPTAEGGMGQAHG